MMKFTHTHTKLLQVIVQQLVEHTEEKATEWEDDNDEQNWELSTTIHAKQKIS